MVREATRTNTGIGGAHVCVFGRGQRGTKTEHFFPVTEIDGESCMLVSTEVGQRARTSACE